MTVLGAHRAVTRARRDGADELFDTCPVDATAPGRSGSCSSAVAPCRHPDRVFLALGVTAIVIRSPGVYGSFGRATVRTSSAAVLLGGGCGRARRGPRPLAPLRAGPGRRRGGGRRSAVLGSARSAGTTGTRYAILSMAPTIEWDSPVFQARPALWHLTWVVGAHGPRGAGRGRPPPARSARTGRGRGRRRGRRRSGHRRHTADVRRLRGADRPCDRAIPPRCRSARPPAP